VSEGLSIRTRKFVVVVSIIGILLGALVLVQHFQNWLYFEENSCRVRAWMCSWDYDDQIEDSPYNASLRIYVWRLHIVDDNITLLWIMPDIFGSGGVLWWEARHWTEERYLPESIDGKTLLLETDEGNETHEFRVELKNDDHFTEGYLHNEEMRYDYWDYTRAWLNGTGWDFYLVLMRS